MNERGDRASVVRTHALAVSVEDPDDRRVDALLVVIGHRQGLRVAFRFVVHPAWPDRVDVPPVRLRLRVHERVAVDLRGREEQEACTLELGETQRIVCSVRADLERVQRHTEVVDRARQRRQVVDEVDRPVDLQVPGHVVVDEEEAPRPVVLDVLQRAGFQVVDTDHAVTTLEQRVTEMRTEETGTAGHNRSRHGASIVRNSDERRFFDRREPTSLRRLPKVEDSTPTGQSTRHPKEPRRGRGSELGAACRGHASGSSAACSRSSRASGKPCSGS